MFRFKNFHFKVLANRQYGRAFGSLVLSALEDGGGFAFQGLTGPLGRVESDLKALRVSEVSPLEGS